MIEFWTVYAVDGLIIRYSSIRHWEYEVILRLTVNKIQIPAGNFPQRPHTYLLQQMLRWEGWRWSPLCWAVGGEEALSEVSCPPPLLSPTPPTRRGRWWPAGGRRWSSWRGTQKADGMGARETPGQGINIFIKHYRHQHVKKLLKLQ